MAHPTSILHQQLIHAIQPRERMITAYSGGIDSTLVAVVARQTLGRDAAPAIIGDSASLPRRELDEARTLAQQLDLQLIEIKPGEQDDPDYQKNHGDRCYHCKSHLYESLWQKADELGIQFIANGTNADDLGDHRPGLDAAREARIVSPLLEAGLSKADVRALAEYLDLPNADKPAAACLSSRLAYGTPVTPERLTRVEAAENALHELGFTGFRVRYHEAPAPIARIEVPLDQIERLTREPVRSAVLNKFHKAGFTYITLDLAGFRSGSGNVVLTVGETQG